ncbi:MAG: rubrerythrin family protein [Actinobacteria bacterium]|nr:rubrerythrin family protein [Actinomycetota bacterium]
MNLAGSKTEANIKAAFAGESQARNKYTYFAAVARKEGYQQIAEIFEETASNEKEHAKLLLKRLGGIGNTRENLKMAAEGEHYEWTSMYKEFEKAAREEGFNEIADFFKGLAAIEKEHDERYKKLLENMEKGEIFKKDRPQEWKCRNCGHIHQGEEAPDVCPVCAHPKGFFEVRTQNY